MNKLKKLKTPQELIHINHTMNIVQYKYWIIFLHSIKNQLKKGIEPDKNGFFYIPMSEVNQMLGLKKAQKKSIIFEDLKNLKNNTVSYNVLEKDGQVAKVGHGFINEWSVSNSRIGFVLPKIFINSMLSLDENEKNIFQLLNWEIFNSFNGKYEAIIYKLCKDYIGVRKTRTMTIQEYRNYIGLKDTQYKDFFRLNEKTIKKPIEEINKSEISDIEVEVHFIRENRKIVALYFSSTNKKLKLPIPREIPKNKVFEQTKITFSESDQKKYLSSFPEDEIIATIERANDYIKELENKGKNIKIGAIYKIAFAEQWGVQHLENKKALEKIENKEIQAEQKKEQLRQQKQKEEQEEKAKSTARTNELIKTFYNKTEEEQRHIIDEIIEQSFSIIKKSYIELYAEHGLNIFRESGQFRGDFIRIFEK